MAWTKVTYACGHTGEEQIYGPRASREREIWKYGQRLCPDCYKAEKEKEAAEAAASNKEYGLPDLIGTPKQIAWAESIRKQQIDQLDGMLEGYVAKVILPENIADLNELRARNSLSMMSKEDVEEMVRSEFSLFYKNICGRTHAHDIIDSREKHLPDVFHRTIYKVIVGEKKPMTSFYVQTVEPENLTHTGAVDLQIEDGTIIARYVKDDDFILIARQKRLHFGAGKVWKKKQLINAASLTDSAADLANALLTAGFRVTFHDHIIQDLAVSGQFTPDNPRMIWGSDKYILITTGPEDKGLDKALERFCYERRFPGDNLCCMKEDWEKLLDVVESYDFVISKDIQELFDKKQKAKVEKIIGKKAKAADSDYLEDILNSSREVIDDLKD